MADELVVKDRNGVRLIVMNRPDKHNALNTDLTRELLVALEAADDDDAVGAVVLTGAGKSFCAGADLGEFKDLTPDRAHLVEARARLTANLHGIFRLMKKPVVSAINGAAMGGGAGLALACDMAVMGETAKLGYPEVKHGIVGAIVMTNLVRQLGRKAAFELVALGEPIVSLRALELGMVNRVVRNADVVKEAVAIAERLAAASRPAMALTKHLFHQVTELPFDQALEKGREANERMRGFPKPGH
jgi:enoyl-CoA hydratase/carnithine racemase